MRKILVSTILMLISIPAFCAEPPRGVPDKLFGITLGGVYEIGGKDNNDVGNLPIKKFAGMNQFFGLGIHYYFQPKENFKYFDYVEKRKKSDDKFFETSFRLYLLPVIPPAIATVEELDKAQLKYEVALIEWANDAKTKDDAYYWALNLCKTFMLDIAAKPEIINNFNDKLYNCTFSSGERVFTVSNFATRSVRLEFKGEVSDIKRDAIDARIRKLQLKEIRPY